jgi:hypothetical protein
MENLTGKKFGRLTVIEYSHKQKYNFYWKCKCDCGKECIIRSSNLKSGHTKSCGCFNKEIVRDKHTIHGDCGTKFYKTFNNINSRCNNKNYDKYEYYGGRGIKCEWNNYLDFKKDMYKSYLIHVKKFGENQTTIDRIDNGGNYSKKNCKWATRKEQSNNTRRTTFIKYKDKTYSRVDICNKFNINPDTFRRRIDNGWELDKALKNKPMKTYDHSILKT